MNNQNSADYYRGYYQGYAKGFQRGLEAYQQGQVAPPEGSQWLTLPIDAMEISSRAINCLRMAGCAQISDVASLDEHALSVMRGLGAKSGAEIAQWLIGHELYHTAWNRFL